jgi:sodium/proline symporter
MTPTTAIITTLIVYKVVLVGIGFWAARRNQDGSDFYLGGRGLGPWVAALSSSASASSAWTMLGLSGLAYAKGLWAFWFVPACISGFIINWLLMARRLRTASDENQSVTLTEFLAADGKGSIARLIKISASVIVLLSLGIYVASQFQGAGKTFQDTLGLDGNTAVMVGAAIVFLYTVTGGFWAVSISDVIQGLMMAIASIIVPVAALMTVGGPAELWTQLSNQPESYLSFTAGKAGLDGVIFVIGLLAIGLGATGQPHVVNRFMALRSEKDVRLGAAVSITWSIIVFSGMFIVGLCGRVLLTDLGDGEVVLVRLTTDLFPPVMAGVFVAAILSAIMSTADSQLLVCGSTIAHDLPRSREPKIWVDRVAIFFVCVGAVVAALTVAKSVFDSALFAWSALGAAFGPVLMVRLFRGPLDARYTLGAIWTGFGVTLLWFFTPALKSCINELLPGYVAALIVAWIGAKHNRNS